MFTDSHTNFTPILVDGHPVGYYALSEPDRNGDRYFAQVFIEELRRNEGIGTRTYVEVARELNNHGQHLVSDPESFSTGALAVWNALESKGFAYSSGTPDIDSLGDVRGAFFKAIVPQL